MSASSKKYDPSCMDDFDPSSLGVDQALRQILNSIDSQTQTEVLPIRDALWRIVAEDIKSKINVPGHTNSAMDGYALHSDLLPSEGTRTVKVVGTAWAGRPYLDQVGNDACVRIMTGAVMPENTDTVIMQERVQKDGDKIVIDHTNTPGQNVRQAGEDIAAGETVLSVGKLVTPAVLGLVASVGINQITVYKKLRVAFSQRVTNYALLVVI